MRWQSVRAYRTLRRKSGATALPAERIGVWRLPPAVITGLPGDLVVSLNYDNPEAIGRVIRELASSPEDSATDT